MKVIMHQLKWQFIILHRNNLIIICAVVTLMYAGIFYVLSDLGKMDKVLTLLIYNDPALIGLFILGLSIIMDKDQQVLTALFVTPVNLHEFLITRVLVLSVIGWLCGLGMGLSALGLSFHIGHFSAGVFGTCMLFSLMGIYLVSYTSEFLMFMLKSIPILLFMSLPLLNYFELTDIGLFKIFPIQGCLDLVISSYEKNPDTPTLLFGYGSMIVWNVLFYIIAFRTFRSKMVNA